MMSFGLFEVASLHLRKVHLVHLGLDTPCMIHPKIATLLVNIIINILILGHPNFLCF